jgi:two-component system, NtrC family, sensor histidine kinase KinB
MSRRLRRRGRAEASGPVDGEAAWLERVLVNLVGNAAKYSPPGHPVTSVLEDGKGEVRVREVDEGARLPRCVAPFRLPVLGQ